MKNLLYTIALILFSQLLSAQTTIECADYPAWEVGAEYNRDLGGQPVWVEFDNALYYMAGDKWYVSGTAPDQTDDWTLLGQCGDQINWCDFGNEWDSEETYSRDPGGERIFVLSRGDLYEMAWGEYWSFNEPPYKEQYSNRWTYRQHCFDYVTPQCGEYALWQSDIPYSKNDEVFYNGLVYKCKNWWSKNKNPGDYQGDWIQIDECEPDGNNESCLYAMWDFNNFSDQVFSDTVAQSPATLHNGGEEVVADNPGVDFNGDDMYLEIDQISDGLSASLNNEGSISCWCMLDGDNEIQHLFHVWQEQGNREVGLYFEQGDTPDQNSIGFYFSDYSMQVTETVQNMPVPINTGDNQWHHLLVNWNRNDGTLSLWVDAVMIAQNQSLDDFNWQMRADHITLGSKTPGFPGTQNEPSELYAGKMDKLRFCSRALSETEIQGMYDMDSPVYEYSLPVELLYFNPECGTYNGVNVEWSTASEVNNDYFTLFRSYDGENWDAIKKIDGAGNTNEVQNYSFHDVEPATHDTYYRLMQTDFDGTSEVFDVLAIYCKYNHKEITIYPNPAREYIMLTFINEHHYEAPVSVKVYDASGRLRHEQNYFADPEYNEMRINLPPQLNAGTYYMQVKLGEQDLYASPFVVQR